MIQFPKPDKLNGEQLLGELNQAGIKIDKFPVIEADGTFWLDIESKDESEALPIVTSHIGIEIVDELTVEQKLASVGLTIQDLKSALGL